MKNLKSRFLQKSFLSMAEQGIFSLASFVTGILLARAAGTEASGIYTLLLSAVMIALGLQRTAVALPFSVLYPKLDSEKEKKKYRAATWNIEVLILFFLVIAMVILRITGILKFDMRPSAMVVFLIGYLLKDFIRQYFYAMDQVGRCLIMGLTQVILQIGILLFLYQNNYFSLDGMLFVIGFTSLFCSLSAAADSFSLKMTPDILKAAIRKNWFTAKWSIGISMSDAVKNQISIWMLNGFVSTEAVGIYNANNTFAMLPQPVFNGLSQFLLPHFSKMFAQHEYRQLLKKTLEAAGMIVICNGGWALCLTIVGTRLIKFIYGQEYQVTLAVMLLCCIRGAFTSLSSIASSVLQAIEKPQYIVKSLAVSIIVMSTAGVLLTWKFQMTGMCAAMALMYVFSAFIQAFYIFKSVKTE